MLDLYLSMPADIRIIILAGIVLFIVMTITEERNK